MGQSQAKQKDTPYEKKDGIGALCVAATYLADRLDVLHGASDIRGSDVDALVDNFILLGIVHIRGSGLHGLLEVRVLLCLGDVGFRRTVISAVHGVAHNLLVSFQIGFLGGVHSLHALLDDTVDLRVGGDAAPKLVHLDEKRALQFLHVQVALSKRLDLLNGGAEVIGGHLDGTLDTFGLDVVEKRLDLLQILLSGLLESLDVLTVGILVVNAVGLAHNGIDSLVNVRQHLWGTSCTLDTIGAP